ncbi:hypothetical protein [Clostridium botulinum]|uniref:hypothetical protein n=1 Tax=Clostridium botulinum TaxID=1491 RepID=UPI000774BE71|nr:hypothetical protein [Clostridium botulinum]AUN04857.1 hypothetical protein RSJ19_18910 [Clostridium botulinum]MBN3396916.1 hypothetical protein [Clostridium botulinum]MBN3412300.1 hypothetical protein [Clostridium botulinum]
MFDKIIDFAKDMKNKFLYYVLIIASLFYLLTKSWKVAEETNTAIVKSLKVILHHLLSLGFIMAIIIGIKYLFKLSEKKSRERIECYNKPIVLENKDEKYINVKLIELGERFNGEYCKTLEILISNLSDTLIDYSRGVIYIRNDNKRVDKIKFETYNLKKTNFERIFYDKIDGRIRNWDRFEIFIEKFKKNDIVEENIMITSPLIIRMHGMELNLSKFYDFSILGIRTNYNLAWLKEKMKIDIIPEIKYFYSKKNKQLLNLELKDLINRLLRFTLVSLVLFLILALIILTLIDIYKMIKVIYIIWNNYFQQITKLQ